MQVFLPAGVKQQDHNQANLTTQDNHIKLWNLSASDFRAPGSVRSSTILFYFLLTISPYILIISYILHPIYFSFFFCESGKQKIIMYEYTKSHYRGDKY